MNLPVPPAGGELDLSTLPLPYALTLQFYAWEQRGRGWRVFERPVSMEPPFRPFRRSLPMPEVVVDDGRRPGLLEVLWNRIRRRSDPPPARSGDVWQDSLDLDDEPDQPPHQDLSFLRLLTPEEYKPDPESARRLLFSLVSSTDQLAFELIAGGGEFRAQLAVAEQDEASVCGALGAYVPDLMAEPGPDFLESAFRFRGATAIAEFGLSREFMLPILVPRSYAVDPLLGLTAAMDRLGSDEAAAVQFLFSAAHQPWAENALAALMDSEGRPFFADAPEMLHLAREKLQEPLLACVVRAATKAGSEERAWNILRRLAGFFRQFSRPPSNEFMPLSNDGYNEFQHEEDLFERRSCRSGMLLSVSELSALVHLPGAGVQARGLRSSGRKTAPAPERLLQGEVRLGLNDHRGRTQEVRLPLEDRLRHTYLIGATGTGKSTLLLDLMRQDAEAGRGFALLDPHGDLAEDLMARIPESRHGEVVIFDPADAEHPIAFNVLHAHSETEKELLASDFVAIFRRFSTSWGDQMTAVMSNAVLAMLEAPEGGTLLDLREFLLDKGFRERFLAKIPDPHVRMFWQKQFPLLFGKAQVSILTRLDAFLRPRLIRNVVAQRKSRLDLSQVIDEGRIFIGRLAQGAIGETNAHLLGSFLLAKFSQIALTRQGRAAGARRPFMLFVDEFHHFLAPSLSAMLSGARKFGVGLVLAHQELRQLGEADIRAAVLTNAHTRVCFRLGDDDSRSLAAGFADFDQTDLQNLAVGEAICRSGQANQNFSLGVPQPIEVSEHTADSRRASIIQSSRERYGTPVAELQSDLVDVQASEEKTAENQPAPVQRRASALESERRSEDLDLPSSLHKSAEESRTDPEPALLPAAHLGAGRGGPKHKYLQALIKSFAESKGYKATVEAPLPNGGRADLLLEKDGETIAVEISITTTAAHELQNLRKCLAGTSRAYVLTLDSKQRDRVLALAAQEISPDEMKRVSILTVEEMLSTTDLAGGSAEAENAQRQVRGFRVKTTLGRHSDEAQKKQSLIRTVMLSLKRLSK